jgi:3-hydroxyisobutyrate dehydrogenase-like beta-hydroxyacid dehydrogenase
MSVVVVGLGPMGAGIGHHLAEVGFEVVGAELDPQRAAEWAGQDFTAYTDLEQVPWQAADAVVVAVRLLAHAQSALEVIARMAGDRPLRIVVVTTLAVSDARAYLPTLPAAWRVFEFPVSGGPEGARAGTLSAMLAGPAPSGFERELLEGIASRIFPVPSYGDPAAFKLLNNTLGAYVASATGQMIELAERLGIEPAQFLEVARASSGQSWMADHFEVFHHPLLIKDVELLLGDEAPLPVVDLNRPQELDELVGRVRARLAEGSAR